MRRDGLNIILTKRFGLIALAFAVLFTIIAGLQYLYVKTQLSAASTATLSDWASQVNDAIDYRDNNGWNIKQYRQSSISAENYVTLARDGTVVEIAGFIPGLITKVDIPFPYQASKPLDFTSTLGERWRLAVYDLQDGKVILGINDVNLVPKPDDLLASASHTFGRSLQDALKVEARQVDINIDYFGRRK